MLIFIARMESAMDERVVISSFVVINPMPKQLIIQTLKSGPTTKSVLYNVLKNALPDILTEEKKSKKLSYLLQKMKSEGIIGVEGRAAHAKWFLIKSIPSMFQ